MIAGFFREGHPRAVLDLPSAAGPLEVEFIVDTGFEGDLALPHALAGRLGVERFGFRRRIIAGGAVVNCPFYEILLEDDESARRVEVLVLEGRPLLGTTFLQDCLLQVEIVEGGEVLVEPLY